MNGYGFSGWSLGLELCLGAAGILSGCSTVKKVVISSPGWSVISLMGPDAFVHKHKTRIAPQDFFSSEPLVWVQLSLISFFGRFFKATSTTCTRSGIISFLPSRRAT